MEGLHKSSGPLLPLTSIFHLAYVICCTRLMTMQPQPRKCMHVGGRGNPHSPKSSSHAEWGSLLRCQAWILGAAGAGSDDFHRGSANNCCIGRSTIWQPVCACSSSQSWTKVKKRAQEIKCRQHVHVYHPVQSACQERLGNIYLQLQCLYLLSILQPVASSRPVCGFQLLACNMQ